VYVVAPEGVEYSTLGGIYEIAHPKQLIIVACKSTELQIPKYHIYLVECHSAKLLWSLFKLSRHFSEMISKLFFLELVYIVSMTIKGVICKYVYFMIIETIFGSRGSSINEVQLFTHKYTHTSSSSSRRTTFSATMSPDFLSLALNTVP